jgi:hypothetical protein
MRIWSGCNRRSTGFDGSLHSILWDRGRCRIHEMVANRWLRTETRLLLMAAWLAYASPTLPASRVEYPRRPKTTGIGSSVCITSACVSAAACAPMIRTAMSF